VQNVKVWLIIVTVAVLGSQEEGGVGPSELQVRCNSNKATHPVLFSGGKVVTTTLYTRSILIHAKLKHLISIP